MAWGLGFRSFSGFKVSDCLRGLGFRALFRIVLRVLGLGFAGFSVWGLGLEASGSGFRV